MFISFWLYVGAVCLGYYIFKLPVDLTKAYILGLMMLMIDNNKNKGIEIND